MDSKGVSEDWLSVWIGLLIFVLALGSLGGVDVLGWVVTTGVWSDLSKALNPVSKAYSGLGGMGALIATYLVLLVVMTAGAAALKADLKRFALGFTAVFWIGYLSWIAGSYANFAVTTPADMQRFGISWSLKLTNEGGFILALLAGLIVGNFFPGFAAWMKEAVRPELYIKTAIVLLGGFLGITAATQPVLAKSVLFRGLAAIVEAYLIYWALVYLIARRVFRLTREWAAPLASGISICGVSAAIATAAAIRARPVVAVMVSSLVVLFAVVELVVLPFAAEAFLVHQPLVAGAWMGLAVKTDGAAVASGAITEALLRARAAAAGITYQEGWMLMTTTTVKVFIDMFIGVWAFVLALVWAYGIRKDEGRTVSARDVWERFPKFVLGYFVTFTALLGLVVARPGLLDAAKLASAETNVFRVLFFVMTFFTIGLVSNFAKLREEGIGRLALVYVVCLFGFIVWIGLAVSWIFFHGMAPPRVG